MRPHAGDALGPLDGFALGDSVGAPVLSDGDRDGDHVGERDGALLGDDGKLVGLPAKATSTRSTLAPPMPSASSAVSNDPSPAACARPIVTCSTRIAAFAGEAPPERSPTLLYCVQRCAGPASFPLALSVRVLR